MRKKTYCSDYVAVFSGTSFYLLFTQCCLIIFDDKQTIKCATFIEGF